MANNKIERIDQEITKVREKIAAVSYTHLVSHYRLRGNLCRTV